MICFLYNITSRTRLCKAICPLWQFPHCRSGFANTLNQGMTLFHWRNAHVSMACQIPQNSYKLSVHGGYSNKLCRCTGMDQNTQDKKNPESQMCHEIFTGTTTNVIAWDDGKLSNNQQTQNWDNGVFTICVIIWCCLYAPLSFTPKDNPQLFHRFMWLLPPNCKLFWWHGTRVCAWLVWWWWAVFGPSRYLSLLGTFTWSSPSHPLNVSQVFWGLIFVIRWSFSPEMKVCFQKVCGVSEDMPSFKSVLMCKNWIQDLS